MIFSIGLIPALGLLLGTLFLPESPRRLMLKELKEKAQYVLEKVRKNKNIQTELQEIQQTLAKGKKEKGAGICYSNLGSGPLCL